MGFLTVVALLFAPWIAIGTILRQRDAFAREQALEFELQRSEFERRESDARLRLLQAQVEPHFLFNTLANVQALVDSGSPRPRKYSTVSLPIYARRCRACIRRPPRWKPKWSWRVPTSISCRCACRIGCSTLSISIRPQRGLHCPPMTLLTLVENAVRHGIDPSETGGRIDVDIWIRDDRCVMRVKDTGVGLKNVTRGLGTGLSTLRERLKLAFGANAHFSLTEIAPRGVCAEVSIPGREAGS